MVRKGVIGLIKTGREQFGISLATRDWGLLAMFVWQNGGSFMNAAGDKSEVNTPEFKEALSYYVDFFSEKLAPREFAVGTDIYNVNKIVGFFF